MKNQISYLIGVLVLEISILSFTAYGKIEVANSQNVCVRFEHVAFNVADPVTMANWYVKNLGMKIMRQDGAPTYTTFIADSGEHMMIELFHNADYPLFPAQKINVMSLHLAFCSPDIKKTVEQLLSNGASLADSLKPTASGDLVCILRDPWGLPIQFVQRATPMLRHSGLYIEHFALNLSDSRKTASWYEQNTEMKRIRDGKAPTYGMFVSDSTQAMMFELYQNEEYPVIDFGTISPMSIHVAFQVSSVEQAKQLLVLQGAVVADDITTTPIGDQVLMMRDINGFPIQFVHRAKPMIK